MLMFTDVPCSLMRRMKKMSKLKLEAAEAAED
jgi:hypothetical protein